MLHAAAQRQPYTCFVGPEAKIPFMAMPDAVTSLVSLLEADRAKLSSSVYNVSAFSVSAGEIADRVRKAFPGAKIDFAPDAVRSKIVDSWPEDMDDSLARADWGWKPSYEVDRAFDEYLVPTIRQRHSRSGS
jgi:nucleoside-diphosphate-sugar epimerase